MALAPHHRKNCDTLLQAAADGNVALVECRKRATGEVVAMLCSIGREDGKFAITPFAEMVSGNPFILSWIR